MQALCIKNEQYGLTNSTLFWKKCISLSGENVEVVGDIMSKRGTNMVIKHPALLTVHMDS